MPAGKEDFIEVNVSQGADRDIQTVNSTYFLCCRYELTPTVEMVKLSCGLQEKPRNVIASGPTQPLPPAQNVTANGQVINGSSTICCGSNMSAAVSIFNIKTIHEGRKERR